MVMNIMLLEVLICFWLIDSAHAIESQGFEKCLDFFFNRTPPVMRQTPNDNMFGTDKCLCEQYEGTIYFATYYDTRRKTPVYTAYTILVTENEDNIASSRKWRIDPALKKDEQASIINYHGIGAINYDRGHLAPRFHFSTLNGRKATDVLTNIVPQYKMLNRDTWLYLERKIYAASANHCNAYGGKTFVITGVIPSTHGRSLNGKIDIPSFLWTAVCCDTSKVSNLENRFKGWSFAYMVKNDEHTPHEIETFIINDFLQDERIRHRYVKLFDTIGVVGVVNNAYKYQYVEDCLFDSDTAKEIIEDIATDLKSPNSIITYELFPTPQYDSFIVPLGKWFWGKKKK